MASDSTSTSLGGPKSRFRVGDLVRVPGVKESGKVKWINEWGDVAVEIVTVVASKHLSLVRGSVRE